MLDLVDARVLEDVVQCLPQPSHVLGLRIDEDVEVLRGTRQPGEVERDAAHDLEAHAPVGQCA